MREAKRAYKLYVIQKEVGNSLTKRVHFQMRRVYLNNGYKWFTGECIQKR